MRCAAAALGNGGNGSKRCNAGMSRGGVAGTVLDGRRDRRGVVAGAGGARPRPAVQHPAWIGGWLTIRGRELAVRPRIVVGDLGGAASWRAARDHRAGIAQRAPRGWRAMPATTMRRSPRPRSGRASVRMTRPRSGAPSSSWPAPPRCSISAGSRSGSAAPPIRSFIAEGAGEEACRAHSLRLAAAAAASGPSKRSRKRLRALERDHGKASFVILPPGEDCALAVARIIGWKRVQLAASGGFSPFEAEGARAFLAAAARDPAMPIRHRDAPVGRGDARRLHPDRWRRRRRDHLSMRLRPGTGPLLARHHPAPARRNRCRQARQVGARLRTWRRSLQGRGLRQFHAAAATVRRCGRAARAGNGTAGAARAEAAHQIDAGPLWRDLPRPVWRALRDGLPLRQDFGAIPRSGSGRTVPGRAPRRQQAGIAADPGPFAGDLAIFHFRAAVHHHGDARASAERAAPSLRTESCIQITFGSGSSASASAGNGERRFGIAEDIDHVDRLRHVFQAGMDGAAEYLLAGQARIDRDRGKALVDQIFQNEEDGLTALAEAPTMARCGPSSGWCECSRRRSRS